MEICDLSLEEISAHLAVFRRLTLDVPNSDFNTLLDGLEQGVPVQLGAAVVAREDGAIIGWACGEVWRTVPATPAPSVILGVFVAHRFRGRGIGSALAKALLARLVGYSVSLPAPFWEHILSTLYDHYDYCGGFVVPPQMGEHESCHRHHPSAELPPLPMVPVAHAYGRELLPLSPSGPTPQSRPPLPGQPSTTQATPPPSPAPNLVSSTRQEGGKAPSGPTGM